MMNIIVITLFLSPGLWRLCRASW